MLLSCVRSSRTVSVQTEASLVSCYCGQKQAGGIGNCLTEAKLIFQLSLIYILLIEQIFIICGFDPNYD